MNTIGSSDATSTRAGDDRYLFQKGAFHWREPSFHVQISVGEENCSFP